MHIHIPCVNWSSFSLYYPQFLDSMKHLQSKAPHFFISNRSVQEDVHKSTQTRGRVQIPTGRTIFSGCLQFSRPSLPHSSSSVSPGGRTRRAAAPEELRLCRSWTGSRSPSACWTTCRPRCPGTDPPPPPRPAHSLLHGGERTQCDGGQRAREEPRDKFLTGPDDAANSFLLSVRLKSISPIHQLMLQSVKCLVLSD